MNTIMAYLDNMFNGLPRTAEINRIKQDLLSGMEEKYYELKSQGKSENEAVGIVISEFGNIDELKAELGITQQSEEQQFPELTEEAAYDYIAVKRSNGKWIGIGVIVCLLGVAWLISVVSYVEQFGLANASNSMGEIIGIGGMFVFLAIGVTIFISQGFKIQRFNYLDDGFTLNYYLKSKIKNEQSSFAPTYKASLIIGVCMSILSPIIIFITSLMNEMYAPYIVSAFLLVIGCAVYIFIYYGGIQGAYSKLLEEKNSQMINEQKKLIGPLNTILWTIATAIFLYTGLVNDSWDKNWVIFVIAAVLSGMTGSIATLIKGKQA